VVWWRSGELSVGGLEVLVVEGEIYTKGLNLENIWLVKRGCLEEL